MSDIVLFIGIGLLMVGVLAVQLVITRRRHGRDHRKELEPILNAHGLAFVSARWPGRSKVGPFPKIEIEVSRPQSRVGGIRGEYTEYRIVTVQDSQGNFCYQPLNKIRIGYKVVNTALIIGMVILGGVSLGWVLHHRSVRRMLPILTRLAAEKNGKVELPSLFLMPKLRFSHSGTEVEVSGASTGIAGESSRYTYAKFIGFDFNSFKFRILPRSLQTIGDKWVGQKKPIPSGVDKLDKRLSIYSNNEPLLKAILSARIQADLLLWTEQKTDNRISDIRNDDDNLIFAVTGDLENYEEYKLLLNTACRFFDAATKVVSKYSNDLNDS